MFKVDQVEKSQSFSEIPDGVYPVVITEAKHVSDEKGVRFEFTFVHTEEPYKNRKTWSRHMYVGTATTKKETLSINKALLADLFFVANVTGFDSEEEAHKICDDILGTELKIRIRNSEYQGKTFANVDDYWSPEGNNRSGKKIPTNVAASKAKTQPTQAKKQSSEEDVPF